ncbi:MAG: hypothetical protein FJ104_01160 [Deltaproteobacteria bacterium]|nr:hypothetical protein [Deltaproteobacteria bacterium]
MVGPYFGAWLGSGGPFGGIQTSNDRAPQFSQGLGILGTAGYAFLPNLGVGAFLRYNATERLVSDEVSEMLDENSGSLWLYGLEARGLIGAGPLAAWASLGLALGSASLDLVNRDSNGSATREYRDESTLEMNVMPVLGFGAEVEVVSGLSVGPQLRWYLTSADEVCTEESVRYDGGANGDGYKDKACSNVGNATIPDFVFVGVGATYRLDLGR